MIDDRGLQQLDETTGAALKDQIGAAESTGLDPSAFDPALIKYLIPARDASDFGYSVTFLAVSVIALIGLAAVAFLVRKPPPDTDEPESTPQSKKKDSHG